MELPAHGLSDADFALIDIGGESVLPASSSAAPRSTPVHLPGGTIPPHDGHGPLHLAFGDHGR